MTTHGLVAVTGPSGRLGRALVDAFEGGGWDVTGWGRPRYDLDVPHAADPLFDQAPPDVVVHAAAWTDVDGCSRDPLLATRRNAEAVRELAETCARRGSGFVLVSTNEVFDGRRTDGRGYREDDPPSPINAYGASKLAGEEAARAAFAGAGARGPLWVVRTAWLYGPPGRDFPEKLLAAADRLAPGEGLRVVADEIGSPTYTHDLAAAIAELVARAPGGTYHLVNAGSASRLAWASSVLAARGRDVRVDPISQREFARASVPPAWGVLDAAKAGALGISLRGWEDALADYLGGPAAAR